MPETDRKQTKAFRNTYEAEISASQLISALNA
jgi:hypothetical protein